MTTKTLRRAMYALCLVGTIATLLGLAMGGWPAAAIALGASLLASLVPFSAYTLRQFAAAKQAIADVERRYSQH